MQETLLKELEEALDSNMKETELLKEVKKSVEHYGRYYKAKESASHQDILQTIIPDWKSPLEKAFLWLGGWRPSLTFQLVYALAGQQIEAELAEILGGVDTPTFASLTSSMLSQISTLQIATNKEEEDLNKEMAVLQQSFVDQPLLSLAQAHHLVQVEEGKTGSQTSSLQEGDAAHGGDDRSSGSNKIVSDCDGDHMGADALRLSTLQKVLDVLDPFQKAQHLITAGKLQVALRCIGLKLSGTRVIRKLQIMYSFNVVAATAGWNLTRFEYPKLARFCQAQEEFAEVHGLSQSGKLWKHLSAGDLPESKWLTVFDTPKYKGSKIFLNMVKPQFVDECDPEAHKIAWALFVENVILSLKCNPVAWKRKVDAFRDTHWPINVITTDDSMHGPSIQADVKGRLEPCFMSLVIKKLRAKILDIQSNNKAKVLKNEMKDKKAEFLNKRDALICREATASAASMIQTKITSLQTRYGTLKGANVTAEQLAAVEAQITAMSNAVKLIEGDDKIADMKIAVESIKEPIVSNVKIEEVSGWFDAEAAHHMSFKIGCGYTENDVGVEEGNVFDLGIASPGRAEKSWTDCKAAKNVGHDTVPPESTVLGATFEEGVEAILGGDTDAKSVFLVEFVKRFKSNKRTTTTTAPGEGPSKKTRSATQIDAGIYLQTDSCTVPSFDANDAHPKPHAYKKL
ncbi:hypothetical protein L7F22_031093 [Adiantum nelumboides]|nr:hypothetical protein [Adiantum nelumboides]